MHILFPRRDNYYTLLMISIFVLMFISILTLMLTFICICTFMFMFVFMVMIEYRDAASRGETNPLHELGCCCRPAVTPAHGVVTASVTRIAKIARCCMAYAGAGALCSPAVASAACIGIAPAPSLNCLPSIRQGDQQERLVQSLASL